MKRISYLFRGLLHAKGNNLTKIVSLTIQGNRIKIIKPKCNMVNCSELQLYIERRRNQ